MSYICNLPGVDGKPVKLMATALTYVIYKPNFGELFNAVIEFHKVNAENALLMKDFDEIKDMPSKRDFIDLTKSERDKLYEKNIQLFNKIAAAKSNTEFLTNIAAAFIATGEYPIKRNINDIRAEIPIAWITAGTDEYGEVVKLIDELLPTIQKKTGKP